MYIESTFKGHLTDSQPSNTSIWLISQSTINIIQGIFNEMQITFLIIHYADYYVRWDLSLEQWWLDAVWTDIDIMVTYIEYL